MPHMTGYHDVTNSGCCGEYDAAVLGETDDALQACGSGCSSQMNISQTERILSAGVGGMLTLFGLWRRGLDGLLIALGGGALVYRGATGYCHGYAAMGIDTAEHAEGTVIPAQAGERAEKSVAIQAGAIPHSRSQQAETEADLARRM